MISVGHYTHSRHATYTLLYLTFLRCLFRGKASNRTQAVSLTMYTSLTLMLAGIPLQGGSNFCKCTFTQLVLYLVPLCSRRRRRYIYCLPKNNNLEAFSLGTIGSSLLYQALWKSSHKNTKVLCYLARKRKRRASRARLGLGMTRFVSGFFSCPARACGLDKVPWGGPTRNQNILLSA